MIRENLTCISCPRGCLLQAQGEGNEITVSGNACPRGEDYARQELLAPRRVLTCLMRPAGGGRPVSVRTQEAVPKELLMECAREIYRTHPPRPISRGDVVLENVCGTGISVVATRNA